MIVQYRFVDNEETFVFITRSEVIMDKIKKYKEDLPFIGTIKAVKNYFTIK